MVTRLLSPAPRIASTTRRAKVSASGVSSGLSGDSLVSMLNRGVLPEALARSNSSASVGMRCPSTGFWPANCCAYLLAGLDAADVVALQLGERQAVDGGARRGEPRAVGPAHDVGVQHGIVRQHEHAVPGDGEVGLERRDADLERPGKAGERVLRRQPARAAVALQIEGHERRPIQQDKQSGDC